MDKHFFSKLDIDLAKTHVPDGTALDLKEAAHQYEELIEKSGGIDVQLLGIGEPHGGRMRVCLAAISTRFRSGL